MNTSNFPRRQLIILTIACTAILLLAVIIGLISKNSGSSRTPTYILEETPAGE